MISRTATGVLGVAVGIAGIVTPALAASHTSATPRACPAASAGTSSTFTGVVVRPESSGASSSSNPAQRATPKASTAPSASSSAMALPQIVPSATSSASPTSSPRATATTSPRATATTSPRPAAGSAPTLQIKVSQVSSGQRSMKGKTYTVVDCNNQAIAVRRGDRVTVTSYRVRGDDHRLYARQIRDNSRSTTPGQSPKPTASPQPTRSPQRG